MIETLRHLLGICGESHINIYTVILSIIILKYIYEKNTSKTDMSSDSFLSKNVRPMVLIFLVVSTVLIVFIDAGVISFEVKESWIDLLQLVLITVIGAYFGGRSYEKIKK